ncbi:MAG: hypothetical protein RL722_2890 [Pseudomonadota bacterium]
MSRPLSRQLRWPALPIPFRPLPMSHSFLLIEDETVLAKNIVLYLQRFGHEVMAVETAEAGLAALDELRPDAVVLDFNLPGMDGLSALAQLRSRAPDLPVVMITGHGHVELAVEAMKAGAADFLTKPIVLAKLQVVLEKAVASSHRDMRLVQLERRQALGPADMPDFSEGPMAALLGQSPPMQTLRQTLARLLEAERGLGEHEPPAVLIRGETGTGKELVARALHLGGPRAGKPFVELNCAALPAQLLESELFGHERGAFTDAHSRKLGLVEAAEGGTLFLDEIGDMDLALQVKLLKLLEDKQVRRLGAVREQRVDVRIVAATHQPLEELVQQGRFRADLFYRLNVVRLELPPLRDRGADIALLAAHFVSQHARRYGKREPDLDNKALARLLAHHWPGNVRELRNLLDQAVLLAHDGHISADSLSLPSRPVPAGSSSRWSSGAFERGLGDAPARGTWQGAGHAGMTGSGQGSLQRGWTASGSAPDLVDFASPLQGSASWDVRHPPLPMPRQAAPTLPELERQALLDALERTRWNVSRAARELDISRDALRYRMAKHGLAGEPEA